MRITGLILVAILAVASCESEGVVDADIEVKEGEKRSKLAADTENVEELKKAAEERRKKREQEQEERRANQTTMEVTPLVHDFGTVDKETPVSTVFTVKNTGDKPLTINDAQASCGCTVPRKPEEPILPGETGEVEVTFTSKPGQEGKPFSKAVTLTANIPGSTKRVTIKGNVNP